MKTALILLALVILTCEAAPGKTLANKLKVCRPKDAGFQECFRKSMEMAFRTLKNGDRSRGIVPVDPLDVPFMEMRQPNGNVGMSLKFTNCKHHGLSSIQILSVKAMPEKYRFEMKVKMPYYTVSGPYEASGRILLLPFSGKGMCNITMYDTHADWLMEGKPKVKDGKTYMEITNYSLKIKPDRAYFELSNLFNGDERLGETTNRFLNENNRDVIQEMASNLNEAISQLHGGLAQRILDQLPYDEAFPGL